MVKREKDGPYDRIQSFKGQLQRYPSDCARDAYLGRFFEYDLWWAMPETHTDADKATAPDVIIVAEVAHPSSGIVYTSYTEEECQRLSNRASVTDKEGAAIECWVRSTRLCSKHRMEIALGFQEAKAYG